MYVAHCVSTQCSTQDHDIILTENIVEKEELSSAVLTVNHIQALVKFQEKHDLKIAPKLKDKLLLPTHFDKMSVSSALAVLDHASASGLCYLVNKCHFSLDLLTTAFSLLIWCTSGMTLQIQDAWAWL